MPEPLITHAPLVVADRAPRGVPSEATKTPARLRVKRRLAADKVHRARSQAERVTPGASRATAGAASIAAGLTLGSAE